MKKIGILSGKGGVGKTTIAINLAAVNKAALLDADITCPNVHKFLRVKGELLVEDGKIVPIREFDMEIVSTAFMSEEEQPIAFRGPMISKTIGELLLKTKWSKKIMFIDMPPGTSDAVLSIFNLINDVVIVTEPTEVAAADAIRTIALARKYNKNILGIIENKSGEIFGKGMGALIAKKYDLKFLGEIPLDKRFIEAVEIGKPAAMVYDDIRELFSEISKRMGI